MDIAKSLRTYPVRNFVIRRGDAWKWVTKRWPSVAGYFYWAETFYKCVLRACVGSNPSRSRAFLHSDDFHIRQIHKIKLRYRFTIDLGNHHGASPSYQTKLKGLLFDKTNHLRLAHVTDQSKYWWLSNTTRPRSATRWLMNETHTLRIPVMHQTTLKDGNWLT